MAITFVASGGISSQSTTVTPTLPAGYQAGDIFILSVLQGSKNYTGTPPTGYTLVSQANSSTVTSGNMYYKIAAASETSPTVSTGGSNGQAVIVAYRGSSGLDVTATAFAASTSSTSLTGNNLTTTAANDFVITSVNGENATGNNFTAPSGVNIRVQQNGTTSLTPFLLYDELQPSAGVYTAKTTTTPVNGKYVILATSLLDASPAATGNMFFMF